MVKSALDGNMAPRLANHHAEFALVVVSARDRVRRASQRLAVADVGGRYSKEDMGEIPRGREAGFLDMRLEVQGQRPERIRPIEEGLQGHAGKTPAARAVDFR